MSRTVPRTEQELVKWWLVVMVMVGSQRVAESPYVGPSSVTTERVSRGI